MMKVLSPGAQSSLQDLGRFGWQSSGIGTSGAMDSWAARVANALLDNAPGASVLEMCASGATLRVEQPVWIAVSGADMDARIDGAELPPGTPVRVGGGSVLRFGSARRGWRAYLAVRGGFVADRWLASTATDQRVGRGGIEGRCLRRDDWLCHAPDQGSTSMCRAGWSTPLALASPDPTVRLGLLPGAALEQLDVAQRRALEQPFTVSREADRMGLRLEQAVPAAHAIPAILSQAVAFGSVQLPPDGKPIILGADRQTTGGYPLLGVVAGIDHSTLAQLRSGDGLLFRLTDVHAAQAAWQARERVFQRFRVAVHAWWQELS